MIYQQHSAEADVPAMMGMALPAGSSSCFCSYAEAVAVTEEDLAVSAVTAAASSGFCCFLAAAVAAKEVSAEAAAVAAKIS